MNKLTLLYHIYKNQGWDYVSFRIWYELKRKTGILKRQFPPSPPKKEFTTLEDWKTQKVKFFFDNKKSLSAPKKPVSVLKENHHAFLDGKVQYFNATYLEIGRDYDWITNPDSGYQYDINKHWTEVEDLSKEAGDIKYVWEKSRFSFLCNIIRYDYHFEKDCAELVFSEIENWCDQNPINQGPNYKCSQETSLRILNWTFALYYYKDSKSVTEERFDKIIHYIYWQLKHVYENIHFSRKTVRNNHAVTETLMLYLGGLLFPFFPEANHWKQKGKQWFEKEIAYQIYNDGTFLQFSHNYHRVLVQLLTWAFYLTDVNGEKLSDLTYSKAKKTLNYLFQCCNPENGHLPNYGANDGALFFKLNNAEYRDFRPQINALAYYFDRKVLFKGEIQEEDIYWLKGNLSNEKTKPALNLEYQSISKFKNGGYYLIGDDNSFSFIKCGSYKDRPSHADNLHIDIWWEGNNILRDAGTYKYNTGKELVHYFNGTSAHNTISIGEADQMKKGPRFIWFHWSKAVFANVKEHNDHYRFEGKIQAFQHLGSDIFHHRTIIKHKNVLKWEIEDTVTHNTGLPIYQYWNASDIFLENFRISATDGEGNELFLKMKKGFYSSKYGIKEESKVILFETKLKTIKTTIEIK